MQLHVSSCRMTSPSSPAPQRWDARLWAVSGYVLGYGGLLLLGGRVADLLGRRRTLLVALGVFTVASALGALVDDGTLLVVTRFVKGMAAAFTTPAGLSIITTSFSEGC